MARRGRAWPVRTSYVSPPTSIPESVPDLQLWFRAADLSSLADTAAVTSWSSVLGNSTATQGTGAKQPTKQTSSGATVVRFDGTDDALTLDGTALTFSQNVAGITVFVKAKLNSVPANGYYFAAQAGSASDGRFYLRVASTFYQLGGARLDSEASVLVGSTAANTSLHVVCGVADYANNDGFVYVDGAAAGSSTSWGTAGNTSNTASTATRFGGNPFASGFMAMDLYEVIAYSRVLTTTERQQVEAYLAGAADAGPEFKIDPIVVDGLPAPLALPSTFVNTPRSDPPVAVSGASPRAIVVPSQEIALPQPFAFVNAPHASIDARQQSLVVSALELPQPQPFALVNTPRSDPPVAASGASPRPVVVPSQQVVPPQPFAFVNAPHASIDARQQPLVVSALELPQPQPFVWVSKTEPPVVTSQVPPKPVVITAEPPVVAPFIGHTGFSVDSSVIPLAATARASVVSQQPLIVQPFVWVSKTEPPVVASQVPPKPTVVTAEPPVAAPFVGHTSFSVDSSVALPGSRRPVVVTAEPPIAAPFVGHTGFSVDSGIVPPAPPRPTRVWAQEPPPLVDQIILWTVASDADPPLPTVVRAAELPQQLPFVFIGDIKVPPAIFPAIPIRPAVVNAQPLPRPVQSPIVWQPKVDLAAQPPVPIKPVVVNALPLPQPVQVPLVNRTPFDEKIVGRPTVVNAQQLPLPVQSPIVWQPKVDLAAQPLVPIRPTVVNAQQLPQSMQSPLVNRTWFDEGIFGRPTVVNAQQLPPPAPSLIVWQPKVDPAAQPPVSIKPTVVNAQPLPSPTQAPQVVQQRVDPAAQPPVPTRPTVVNAQSVPPQYGQSSVGHGFADAFAAAEPPPKPIVIGAQPYPPQVQSPHVNWTPFDEKIVGRPQVIGQQPIPPQAAFVLAPDGGRWGDPPPRAIQPQVNTDMSLPFRPNGWARVAHGFAEALPLLFEGAITGGVLPGSGIAGAGSVGGSLAGQIQTGYVAGGVR